MLKAEDAIRIDLETPPSRIASGRSPIRVYVFKCQCGQEARSRQSYLHKHSGLCAACNARVLIPKAMDAVRLRPFEARYNVLKKRAAGFCSLTYEEYLQFTKQENCSYCEGKIPWTAHRNHTSCWLDRKDNLQGYHVDNVVVCCERCNRTKGDRYSYEEFLKLAPILKEIQKGRTSGLTSDPKRRAPSRR